MPNLQNERMVINCWDNFLTSAKKDTVAKYHEGVEEYALYCLRNKYDTCSTTGMILPACVRETISDLEIKPVIIV